jgi:diacylglycerol O-acyltransferase
MWEADVSEGRRDLTPADAVWLYSEWEKNHQTVSGYMQLRGRVGRDDFMAIVRERLLETYPVFSKKAVMSRNPLMMPHWEFDPDFDLETHVEEVQLPEPGDKATLERVIGEQRSLLLDHDHPLWKFYLIQGYDGDNSVLHGRIQHSIADGWSLVRLILSLADAEDDSQKVSVVDRARRRKRDRLAEAAASQVSAATESVAGAADKASALLSVGSDVASGPEAAEETITISEDQANLVEAGTEVSEQVVSTVSRAAEALKAAAKGAIDQLGLHAKDVVDTAELASRGVRDAVEFTLPPRPGKTILHGKVSGEKLVAWIEPVSLAEVKAIGRTYDATINDTVLGMVTNALRLYLLEKDALNVDEIFTAVPISLRKPDDPLPRTLGNKFGLVPVMYPVGLADPVDQILEIKKQIDDLKASTMPVVSFGLSSLSATFTPKVERIVHKLNQAQSLGVTTNVPGPRGPISVAGVPVVQMWGMGGLSGNMNVSFGIFSLNGELNFSITSDAAITSDPERVLDHFLTTFDELKERSGVGA